MLRNNAHKEFDLIDPADCAHNGARHNLNCEVDMHRATDQTPMIKLGYQIGKGWKKHAEYWIERRRLDGVPVLWKIHCCDSELFGGSCRCSSLPYPDKHEPITMIGQALPREIDAVRRFMGEEWLITNGMGEFDD